MSIKKNLSLQTAYQILNTIIPLITAPYLARVLGATALGVFSYTQSIVGYFTLVAMLGITTFGIRTIAATNNNRDARSKTFCTIYTFQLIMCVASLCLYWVYLLLFCRDNRLIAIIQSFELITCILNISWFYFGIEKFSITVTWNFIIRITTVLLVFLLVKSPEDLWIYAMIMSISTCVAQGVLWFHLHNFISFSKVDWKEVYAIIKPILVLFIPIAAMSVYHIMDKTMLGAMSSFEQSGFYYNSDKVINIPAGIISGIGTVLMPRISSLKYEGKEEEAKLLFNKSLEGTIFICSAISFGIAAVSREFVPIFFGAGYEPCILLICLFAPVLIIKGYSFTARYQFIIPWKKDRIYVVSIIGGVVTNLCANLILIPKYGAIGATIGTIIAELFSCLIQYLLIRKFISYRKSILFSAGYLIIGIIMFISVRLIASFFKDGVLALIVEIIFGACVYLIMSYLYMRITNRTSMIIDYCKNTFLEKILVRRKK